MLNLTEKLSNKGYNVYTDNYYTSPDLFLKLHSAGFNACGTVRKDRKGLTSSFKSATLSKGDYTHFH